MSVIACQPNHPASAAELAWRRALNRVLNDGEEVSPRGMRTRELLGHVVSCDMARAATWAAARKLNYKFMCAEALWILAADDRLAPLARFVKRMADFSDDGATLAGAYGPRLVPQLPYVVDALVRDPDTRQAVATIWTPSPAPSKDVPCTVAVSFSLRRGRVHQQVFMRSSDLWLGLPYDLFSFACWGIKVACAVNSRLAAAATLPGPVGLGHLTVTAASSHLYERDWDAARAVLSTPPGPLPPPCPDAPVVAGDWGALAADLEAQREGRPPARWQVRP